MKNDQQAFKDYVKWALVGASIAGLLLFLIVLALTRETFHPIFDYSSTGQIGDTIGGVTAPFIGISVAILTFLAFFMQFKANETHNRQFAEQSLEKEREKYENKILYLIKQNRNIAEKMSIGDEYEGTKCFAKMFNEFRVAYEIVSSFYKAEELSPKEIIGISFLLFYNGIGEKSNILNNNILKNTPKLYELLTAFDDIISNVKNLKIAPIIKKSHGITYDETWLNKLKYKPFDGHTTRLGQYFRNLFHILSYTQDIDNKYISENEKYEFIKSLRSQLSSYEQMLIYFNSLSLYGMPLKDNGFINTYQLIKNIPIPLVAFAGDIHEYYDDISFEWDEIIERANNYQ